MKTMVPLVSDVVKQMVGCAGIIANFEHEIFTIDASTKFNEKGITSPIEQVFWLCFETVRRVNFYSVIDEVGCIHSGENLLGMALIPQFQVGKYRVDFLAQHHIFNKSVSAIVECDSRQFHDRNEPERRYEKQRDRFLQSKGYRLFHFTGSEIFEDGIKCAAEVISYLTDSPINELIDQVNLYANAVDKVQF